MLDMPRHYNIGWHWMQMSMQVGVFYSSQGVQDGSQHQSQIAFVEMWLLSFSDVLVISAYSTFGYVPQGTHWLHWKFTNLKLVGHIWNWKGFPIVSIGWLSISWNVSTHCYDRLICELSMLNSGQFGKRLVWEQMYTMTYVLTKLKWTC